MDKHVFPRLSLNKSVTLGSIEPFNGAFFHEAFLPKGIYEKYVPTFRQESIFAF